jgi:hypothetical protein
LVSDNSSLITCLKVPTSFNRKTYRDDVLWLQGCDLLISVRISDRWIIEHREHVGVSECWNLIER